MSMRSFDPFGGGTMIDFERAAPDAHCSVCAQDNDTRRVRDPFSRHIPASNDIRLSFAIGLKTSLPR